QALTDGIAPVGRIDGGGPGYSEPTVMLAGDGPSELAGAVISLRWNVEPSKGLRNYRIETSLDGVAFETAAQGRLEGIRERQHLVFDRPLMARYLRVVDPDCEGQAKCSSFIGEIMAIATPGTHPAGIPAANLV